MKKLILIRWPRVTEICETDKEHRIHFCERIIEAFKKRGFEIDLLTTYSVWSVYSKDTHRVDWLRLPHLSHGSLSALICYCDIEGEEISPVTLIKSRQPLSTLEKFQQIKVACKAGFQILVNQHLGTRVYENGVQNQCPIDEYIVMMEGGGLNPFGTVFHRPEDFATTCKQIIENNSIYELFLYIDNVKVNYKVIHYDFALVVDEAWKLLSEFGKVEE